MGWCQELDKRQKQGGATQFQSNFSFAYEFPHFTKACLQDLQLSLLPLNGSWVFPLRLSISLSLFILNPYLRYAIIYLLDSLIFLLFNPSPPELEIKLRTYFYAYQASALLLTPHPSPLFTTDNFFFFFFIEPLALGMLGKCCSTNEQYPQPY